MQQIMDILGIGKMHIASFSLIVEPGELPIVTVTHYPEGKEQIPEELVKDSFDLVLREAH